jgi:SAM-dependent methyltransferase
MATAASDTSCLACGSPAPPAERFAGHDRLHGVDGEVEVQVCAECGSGTTNPRVADPDLGALYPQAYSPYGDAGRGGGVAGGVVATLSRLIRARQGRVALRTFPLSVLAGRSPGRGLDVGCGRGDLAAQLGSAGWSMVGIEPSPAACEAARARGVDAREGTLSTVGLEPAAYDLVVFQHSLEHTDDPRGDLERVAAALAPGGIVVITVPNFGSWQARRFRSRWFHLDLPRHRTHFTRRGLERVFARAGLQPQRIATSTSTVGLPATLQYAIAGRCLFPGGLALRVAAGLCVLALPFARVADRIGGGGDQLHAVAGAALRDA